MATGMNAETGEIISGIDHLKQSIKDILMTRIGTRVMRRDYGSDVPNLIDRPVNDDLAVDLYVAVAEAFNKWEPRLRLREVSFQKVEPGVINFTFTGEHLPDGKVVKLEGIIVG